MISWQEQTHHFRGDVGVRQASVLTHDGQVTVDVDRQRVAGQNHDPADTHTIKDTKQIYDIESLFTSVVADGLNRTLVKQVIK